MRVIVCGSRSAWENVTAQQELLNELDSLPENLILVHGDCKNSPDIWADNYGRLYGAEIELYPADWSKGRHAGFDRNFEMAETGADLCIAVWDGKSRGTLNMIVESTLHGIPVKIIPTKQCYSGYELEKKIPTNLIAEIFEEWKHEYGPTFPLYGNDTKRSDISGSIRPLLSSTAISHVKVLAAVTGLSKKKIDNILSGNITELDFDLAELLVSAMDHEWEWHYGRLENYYI